MQICWQKAIMTEKRTDKIKDIEQTKPTRQNALEIGSKAHQIASGASASPPPLDSAAVTRIQRDPYNTPRNDILALQRTVGNRAVAALVRGETHDVAIQTKLEVGPVNDAYEQEADRVARLVTSGIAQRKPAANVKSRDEESEGETPPSGPAFTVKRMVQRKGATTKGVRSDGSFTADASVHTRIRRMESSGRPLSEGVRRQMEPGFGADLSHVRIHTGGDAVQLSRDIGARAFTHGSHIAFAAGQYNPNSQGGRGLLAHELTHTIQQTGARPLPSIQRSPKVGRKRGPKSVIQRASTWEKIKGFFYRSKVEAPPPIDMSVGVGQLPENIQAAAKATAQKAYADATGLIATAKSQADEKMNSHSMTSDMEVAAKGLGGEPILGGLLNIGAKTSGYGGGSGAINRVKAGDESQKRFLVKFKEDLDGIKAKIQSNLIRIVAVDEEFKPKSGLNDGRDAKMKALQSHAYAKEAEELVASIRKQSQEMGHKAEVEKAVATTDIGSRSLFYSARSLPAAEKSASDSVLNLNRLKDKVTGHVAYLKADLEVLKGYVAAKSDAISDKHGDGVVLRALGSGKARGQHVGMYRPLGKDDAFALAGQEFGMNGGLPDPGEESEQEGHLQIAQDELGKIYGNNHARTHGSPDSVKSKRQHHQKSKLSKEKKAFAKQVRDLEVTSMLLAKAEKRIPVVDNAQKVVDEHHTKATTLYNEIDLLRKENPNPAQEITDRAILKAGQAHQLVAEGVVQSHLTYKLKTEVYNESQKSRYKHVGPRAMSRTKRRFKKLGAMVGNIGARLMTGGMLGMQAVDEAGGYRVNVEKRTIADDIDRKAMELEQLLVGVKDSHVRGLGGDNGAIAYAFFKLFSFLIQIVRDIFTSLALWVTLVTAGAGAPVGAIFGSIALFATIIKGIIDLLLFTWSGIGLMKTNDPRSRSILRSENRTQMISVGEALISGGVAGMTMGLSGDHGMMRGAEQGNAFGNDIANVAVGPGIKIVGNIGQNVAANNLSRYNDEVGIEQRYMKQRVLVRKAKPAMATLVKPVGSAFNSLEQFITKKKSLQKSKISKAIPRLAKSIRTMNLRMQGVPEVEVGEQRMSGRPQRPPPLPPRVVSESSHEGVEPPVGGPLPMPSPIGESMDEEGM